MRAYVRIQLVVALVVACGVVATAGPAHASRPDVAPAVTAPTARPDVAPARDARAVRGAAVRACPVTHPGGPRPPRMAMLNFGQELGSSVRSAPVRQRDIVDADPNADVLHAIRALAGHPAEDAVVSGEERPGASYRGAGLRSTRTVQRRRRYTSRVRTDRVRAIRTDVRTSRLLARPRDAGRRVLSIVLDVPSLATFACRTPPTALSNRARGGAPGARQVTLERRSDFRPYPDAAGGAAGRRPLRLWRVCAGEMFAGRLLRPRLGCLMRGTDP